MKLTEKHLHKLKMELLEDCREQHFYTVVQFVNYFYNNYLDKSKFRDEKQYEYMLTNDRFQKGYFNPIHTTNYLIKNRTEFLDMEKLKSYGIC